MIRARNTPPHGTPPSPVLLLLHRWGGMPAVRRGWSPHPGLTQLVHGPPVLLVEGELHDGAGGLADLGLDGHGRWGENGGGGGQPWGLAPTNFPPPPRPPPLAHTVAHSRVHCHARVYTHARRHTACPPPYPCCRQGLCPPPCSASGASPSRSPSRSGSAPARAAPASPFWPDPRRAGRRRCCGGRRWHACGRPWRWRGSRGAPVRRPSRAGFG